MAVRGTGSRIAPVAGLAHDGNIVEGIDQGMNAGTNQVVVLGQQYAYLIHHRQLSHSGGGAEEPAS